MRTVHAYTSEFAVRNGGDPHGVKILITDHEYDLHARNRVAENKYLGRNQIGEYTTVIDRKTGHTYHLASAPCGLGCRCAAVAVLACSECGREDGIIIDDGICVTCHSRLNGEDDAAQ